MTMATPADFASLECPKYDYYSGDFDDDDDNQTEDIERYEPGGFCPIDLSMRDKPRFINDQFQVIYKLGVGGYGTVWLCYDLVTKAWRAVKVHQARHSALSQLSEACGDILVSQTIKKYSISTKEALDNGVALPLETFWIDSPNGRHMCTVLPFLGPRLSDLMKQMPGDDPARINRISYRIVQGMDYLHRHGLCHGDFRPDNVLLKLKDGLLDGLSVDEMRKLLGPPARGVLVLRDGQLSPHAPRMIVSSMDWEKLWEYVTDDIAIVDFGESYTTSNSNPPPLGIPKGFAAPEILLGGDKGTATDLWALGCTLLNLRCRSIPYTLSYDFDLLRLMENWMGPCLPPFRLAALREFHEERLDKWTRCGGEESGIPRPQPPDSVEAFRMQPSTYVTETDWRVKDSTRSGDRNESLEDYLRREHYGGVADEELISFTLTAEEVQSFGDLLHKIFQWQPEQRWDTGRIMGHAWFKSLNGSLERPVSAQEQQLLKVRSDLPIESEAPGDSDDSIPTVDECNVGPMNSDAAVWKPSTLLRKITLGSYIFGIFVALIYFVAHLIIARWPGFLTFPQSISPRSDSAVQLAAPDDDVVVLFVRQTAKP